MSPYLGDRSFGEEDTQGRAGAPGTQGSPGALASVELDNCPLPEADLNQLGPSGTDCPGAGTKPSLRETLHRLGHGGKEQQERSSLNFLGCVAVPARQRGAS